LVSNSAAGLNAQPLGKNGIFSKSAAGCQRLVALPALFPVISRPARVSALFIYGGPGSRDQEV
jgi:hypothetical protein